MTARFALTFGERFGSDDRIVSHARFHHTGLAKKDSAELIVSPSLPVTVLSIGGDRFRRTLVPRALIFIGINFVIGVEGSGDGDVSLR